MSLENLLKISTAAIKRVVPTQSAAGGQIRAGSYTTANRAGLPTSTTGRLNQDPGRRQFLWGGHSYIFDAVWYTKTNPQCDNRDQLIIGSETYFVQAQNNPDRASVYFIVGLSLTSLNLQA